MSVHVLVSYKAHDHAHPWMISSISTLNQNKRLSLVKRSGIVSKLTVILARYFSLSFIHSFVAIYIDVSTVRATIVTLVKQIWQGSRQILSARPAKIQVCSCSSLSFSSSEISPRALDAADEDCLCCGTALLGLGFAVRALSPTNLLPGHSSLHTGHFSPCCMRKKLRMQWSCSRPLHSRFSQRWP